MLMVLREVHNRFWPGTNGCISRYWESKNKIEERTMGRGLLLWLIGIPLPIILVIWLLGGLH